jgi:hypothetical protein
MKIVSRKINTHRPTPGRTHCQASVDAFGGYVLSGHPVRLSIHCEFEGRRYTVRLDELETHRLKTLLDEVKKLEATPA